MKQAERREYSLKHIRALKRLESPFVRPIMRAIKEQVNAVASALRSGGMTDATTIIDKMVVNEGLAGPILALYKVFAVYQARKTTAQINNSAKVKREVKAGFGVNEELIQEIIRYLTEHVFMKAVVPISATNRELILKFIIKGQEEGWSVDKIAYELERWDMPLWRARMLVRTESLFAMQYGKKRGEANARWETESEWIAANDHRTRHSHRFVDGERVEEGQRFAVPIMKGKIQIGTDMMTGPGDVQASAGNIINCRCTLVTVAKRDKNGRLIAKPNKMLSLANTI